MVNVIDDAEPVSVSVSGGYENFLNYEHMPSGDAIFQVLQNKINFTGLRRDVSPYVRKLMVLGPAFHLNLKLTINNLDASTVVGGVGGFFGTVGCMHNVGSIDYTKMRANLDGVSLWVSVYTPVANQYQLEMYIWDNRYTGYTGGENIWYKGWIFADTAVAPLAYPYVFYIDFLRSNGGKTYTALVYSDAAHTTLLKDMHFTQTTPDLTDFAYFIPAYAINGGGGGASTSAGAIENCLFS